MKVIRGGHELPPGKACLAIGVFDGVHLGHQQVIRQTIADARQHEAQAVVLTFDRHPNTVVAPQRVPPLLYSLPQKLRAIAALQPDATLLIPFDEAFSRKTAEEFVQQLVEQFGVVHSICVGRNFSFGYKRGGNVALLEKLGQQFHYKVHGLSALSLDGEVISSTRIRAAVQAGHLDAASQMLGRTYALAGVVARGDQIGQQIGFPTANLDIRGLMVPPNGVYAAHARCHDVIRRAVVNIGIRPTISGGDAALRVEAHLLDFHGDLYEQEVELAFIAKLRDEQKFPSLLALKEQINRDIAAAQQLFPA